jgi:hypothetical protein
VLARLRVDDLVGGAEVDDRVGLDREQLDRLGLVGEDADVLAELERLLLGVREQAAVHRLQVERGPKDLQELPTRLEHVVLIKFGARRGHHQAPDRVGGADRDRPGSWRTS